MEVINSMGYSTSSEISKIDLNLACVLQVNGSLGMKNQDAKNKRTPSLFMLSDFTMQGLRNQKALDVCRFARATMLHAPIACLLLIVSLIGWGLLVCWSHAHFR